MSDTACASRGTRLLIKEISRANFVSAQMTRPEKRDEGLWAGLTGPQLTDLAFSEPGVLRGTYPDIDPRFAAALCSRVSCSWLSRGVGVSMVSPRWARAYGQMMTRKSNSRHYVAGSKPYSDAHPTDARLVRVPRGRNAHGRWDRRERAEVSLGLGFRGAGTLPEWRCNGQALMALIGLDAGERHWLEGCNGRA